MAKYMKPSDYKGQTNNYTYPNEQDPKKKKTLDYYKCVCEAMMSDYASGNYYTSLEFGTERGIEELRAYAKGKQGNDKIKKWILGNKKKQKDGSMGYVTKQNISWDVYQKLPQMLDQMRAKNMSNEYDVDLSCVDDDSVAARQATAGMMKFLLDENTRKFTEKAMYKPSMEPNPEELGLQNADDVDMYIDNGGFMLEWEIAARAACGKTKIVSNYNMLQDEIFDDLLINPEGLTGVKVEIDQSTKTPKIRKVDIRRAVIPFSQRPDFSDIVRAGEIRVMTIADIRKECPWMSDATLRVIAKNFAWMNTDYRLYAERYGYYSTVRTEIDNSFNGYNSDPVNRVKVLVGDFQWLSDDIETRLTNQFGNGGYVYKEVDIDYKADKKSIDKGDRVIKKKVIRKYFAKWIVGTECFLDYGIDKSNVYYGEEGNLTPRLDYFFVKTGNSSMIERCVAIADDINLILIKHRNAWATLPAAPAMAIQKQLVENVFLNGQKQSPMDLIQGLIERGVLYYDALDDHGDPKYINGGQKPIEFMDISRMAGMLTVCSNEMAVKVNELREVLGLQGGSDGGATSPYQGLGQTRLAFEAANASLMPTFKAFHYLFKGMFNHVIKQWQIVATGEKTSIRANALGVKNMKVLELGKDFCNADFNVSVNIAPTTEEKQALLGQIAQLKQVGSTTGGAQGLTASEYLFLYEKIMSGNITEAMYVMAKLEKKKIARADAIQAQNQQANQEANIAATQAKAEADKQNLEVKGMFANMNTALAETLKTNREMLNHLVSPRKEGENGGNQQLAMDVVVQTQEDAAIILSGGQQEQVPQQMEQQPQEMVEETYQEFPNEFGMEGGEMVAEEQDFEI